MADIERDFVHLARLVAQGRNEEAMLVARRGLRHIRTIREDLAGGVDQILSKARVDLQKTAVQPLPVDTDSHLELLRREELVHFESEPVWPPSVKEALNCAVQERALVNELLDAGTLPTRSLLFVGPPGSGKTWAARWLASRLEWPLLTLDLAAVMSSFLGRTGGNIRAVLDYAKKSPCVLLLDEFDAIAKRRDDAAEIGELKRLVNVLLQEVDDWPAQGLLVAATNHPELLDPAVWRRFERIVRFPVPTLDEIQHVLSSRLRDHGLTVAMPTLARVFVGSSFAEIERVVREAKRNALVFRESLSDAIIRACKQLLEDAPKNTKLKLAQELEDSGASQRQVSELTGLSRDTLRKHLSPVPPEDETNATGK